MSNKEKKSKKEKAPRMTRKEKRAAHVLHSAVEQVILEEEPSYDAVWHSEKLPHTKPGYFLWRVKQFLRGLLLGIPFRILVFALILLFNVVMTGYVLDTCFFDRIVDVSVVQGFGKLNPYILGGLVVRQAIQIQDPRSSIPGLDTALDIQLVSTFGTSVLSMFFSYALFRVISLIILRFKSAHLGAFMDFPAMPALVKDYANRANTPLIKHFAAGCFYAFVIGYVIKNPVAIPLFGVMFLLYFAMRENNTPALQKFIFTCTGKEKKTAPLYADAALSVWGLGVGFLLYTVVVAILWNLFFYHFWARTLFTFAFCVLFVFLYSGGRLSGAKKLAVNGILLLLGSSLFVLGFGLIARADDGGWSESGRTIGGWLRNPGTKVLARNGGVKGLAGALGLGGLYDYAEKMLGKGKEAWDKFFKDYENAVAKAGTGEAPRQKIKGQIPADQMDSDSRFHQQERLWKMEDRIRDKIKREGSNPTLQETLQRIMEAKESCYNGNYLSDEQMSGLSRMEGKVFTDAASSDVNIPGKVDYDQVVNTTMNESVEDVVTGRNIQGKIAQAGTVGFVSAVSGGTATIPAVVTMGGFAAGNAGYGMYHDVMDGKISANHGMASAVTQAAVSQSAHFLANEGQNALIGGASNKIFKIQGAPRYEGQDVVHAIGDFTFSNGVSTVNDALTREATGTGGGFFGNGENAIANFATDGVHNVGNSIVDTLHDRVTPGAQRMSNTGNRPNVDNPNADIDNFYQEYGHRNPFHH
ncbi:MAG: hypothetical protein K6A92_11530 [Lachnospiraceae bacterium]|nr:hypothetical protein [Lachnospiraceae bacterium]